MPLTDEGCKKANTAHAGIYRKLMERMANERTEMRFLGRNVRYVRREWRLYKERRTALSDNGG